MRDSISDRPASTAALLRTWLKFFLLLALMTWLLRLISGAVMVPDALWPRAWWWGLRFDLAIAAFLAGLTVIGLWLVSRSPLPVPRRGWLAPAGVVLLAAHLGDWLYWQETGRHIGYEAAELFNSLDSLLNMLVEHWPWIIGLLIATALFFTVRWVEVDKKPGQRLRPELSLLGVLLLSVLFVRSNASGIPQGPHDAMRMADASETAAALNGAYSALHGLQNTHGELRRQPLDWITAREAESNLQALYPIPRAIPEQVQVRPINLFLVFLESWSTRHMQPLEDGTPVTPNFDALAARAFADRDMIAGGMRTTEGMFAVLCSYQNPLGQTLARTPQALFDYDCLPRRLADAGWSTAYFQGSHENTSGVGAYAQSMGYALSEGKQAISRRDYPENNWGVYDHDLYQHVLRALSEMPEPVHIGINTNTTHDIQLREDFAPLVAPDSRLNIERNVLHLADHELGEFVSALEKRDWHYPWMLVLVADHTARVRRTGVERHQVPFAIYAPDLVEPGTPERIAHHRDIAPTIAEILDMPMPYTLGYSLFDESAPQIAEYYHNGTLGWFVGDDQVIEIPLARPEQARCHNWRRNPELDNPQPCRNGSDDQIRRAYSLTKSAQEHLFDNQALSLVPVEQPAEHRFTAR
ncbi:LTA synthase family protein [Thiohalophilus thiocyanatoxydans]|uniref:Phosphoglycerol transferase MdoB-like AlkP superfamily enzyme n=1 Tax=Thiohalophilus thiocyanatoxydans TaxID=381308 RepID=A0A4V3H3Q7_9GAMM|nr:LTA synthase family protein [Thiohalophilus thiocyanatoxydans]TDY00105.1 phosphoglycerol transferase MdoB-like AlkP superfamily enzyme [Thiohalophilus thiocyanatoxydans]